MINEPRRALAGAADLSTLQQRFFEGIFEWAGTSFAAHPSLLVFFFFLVICRSTHDDASATATRAACSENVSALPPREFEISARGDRIDYI